MFQMPQIAPTIEKYIAEWFGEEHKGTITVKASTGSQTLELTDPSEFSAIVDILRNEKPVFLKPKFHIITHWEEVGEGEI